MEIFIAFVFVYFCAYTLARLWEVREQKKVERKDGYKPFVYHTIWSEENAKNTNNQQQ